MFFELHEENKIGYKELSHADLGRKATSNQTHIGLFDDVLTFLGNSVRIPDAMAIYNEHAEMLSLHFDRIQNPDGSFRSPKIRSGRDTNSVLSFIRRTVRNVDPEGTWYLFWFGLKSKQPVFLFFNKGSKTYHDLCRLGINLQPSIKDRLDSGDPAFARLVHYLERVVNISGNSFAEELELSVQTGRVSVPNVRRYNFRKAYDRSVKVGREGEVLIDLFLASQKASGQILSYQWMNQNEESGLPYDFCFENVNGHFTYLDVKTTDYRFEQKMVFSNQEIAFASEHNDSYCIYRVYCDEHGNRLLRICIDSEGLFHQINRKTDAYKDEIIDLANVQTIKLALSPCDFTFEPACPIALSSYRA